jgi:hypothetical protein
MLPAAPEPEADEAGVRPVLEPGLQEELAHAVLEAGHRALAVRAFEDLVQSAGPSPEGARAVAALRATRRLAPAA